MADASIIELENAAKILLGPPNLVSNNERHTAEQIFLQFRQRKAPYTFCKQILDNSQVEYVQFEAAETIKNGLIKEWSFLMESVKLSLRQYLIHYVTSRNPAPFVREKVLQVIAVMVKRSSVDDSGRERGEVLQDIETLILNGNSNEKLVGFKMISCLLQEYSTTTKSTDVGLAWEVHFKAKKQFESSDLKRVFQFCIQLLSEVVKHDPPYTDDILLIMGHILQIADTILTWIYMPSMLSKRLIGIYECVYEADQAPALRLDSEWSDVMFNSDFLPLIFKVYWNVRDCDNVAHHAVTCLTQLASLNGPIMQNAISKFMYIQDFMDNFSKLVANTTLSSKESLNISTIVKKMVIFHFNELIQLSYALKDVYFKQLIQMTCVFCQKATLDQTSMCDENYYHGAFENMMIAWSHIVPGLSVNDWDNINESAIAIFNCYLQCHLSPPDGTRQNVDNNLDIDDTEESDRVLFKDQLQTIGMFGRLVPRHTLPILYKVLEANTEKLVTILRTMENCRQQNVKMEMSSSVFESIFEDIHWTILIAGHILAMDSEGETPMIPAEMVDYSTELTSQNEVTIEATLSVLMSVHDLTKAPEALEQCDHIIRIFSDVLRLCIVESSAAQTGLGYLMSPEVTSTMMWFLKRWFLSYCSSVVLSLGKFNPSRAFVLPAFTVGMCDGAEGSKYICNLVLEKIYSNLSHYSTEPVLLRDTIDLLATFVSLKQKVSTCILESDSLRKLVEFQEKVEAGKLPATVRTDLIRGLILTGAALQVIDDNTIMTYYTKILTPIQMRFKSAVGNPNFRTEYHKERIQHEIIDILECLSGVAKGCHWSTAEILFQFVAPILADIPELLNLYHNYHVIVEMILELFVQYAKTMLSILSPSDTNKLYDYILTTVKVYTKCNTNKMNWELFAEENSFQNISLILDLLRFSLSKCCIDPHGANSNGDSEEMATPDVSIFGLNLVMPLMTAELLNYPELCTKFYRLLVLINDVYPEKMSNLPSPMDQQFLRAIELGLTVFGSDTVLACLDLVESMSTYIFNKSIRLHSPDSMANVQPIMRPFLKLLLDLTLSRQINSDLITSVGMCVYSLCCCYESEYQTLVNQLIELQTDPMIANRLTMAFQSLTTNVTFIMDRQSKIKFSENYIKFASSVRGFLNVK